MKNTRKIRWWMLIYTVAIALLFVFAAISTSHKPKPHHSLAYDIFGDVGGILMFAGNLLYAFGYAPPLLREIWKVAVPWIILSFVAAAVVGVHSNSSAEKHGSTTYVISWIVALGVFFASFRANFLIGYGDVERVRGLAPPADMSEDPMRDLVREMTKMRRTAQVSWIDQTDATPTPAASP